MSFINYDEIDPYGTTNYELGELGSGLYGLWGDGMGSPDSSLDYSLGGSWNLGYSDPNTGTWMDFNTGSGWEYGDDTYGATGNSTDILGGLGKLLSGGISSLGGLEGLLSTGLGALGMYGNYQAGKDRNALDRDVQLGTLKLANDKFGLEAGIDDMASKAMGMQLLVNRGRMAPDQTNPWLNFMFQGRQNMFADNPELAKTFSNNPFAGFGSGTPNFHPTSDMIKESVGSGRPGFTPQFGSGSMSSLSGLDRIQSLLMEGGLTSDEQKILDALQTGGVAMNQGGLSRAQGLLRGDTGGQADLMTAQLSPGEYVIDAETVAQLGDGNTEAGAQKLDQFRRRVRQHKRNAPVDDIPPPAKPIESYLKRGK